MRKTQNDGVSNQSGDTGRTKIPSPQLALALSAAVHAGAGYHARSEYIEADAIEPRLNLMARMLQELGRAQQGQ